MRPLTRAMLCCGVLCCRLLCAGGAAGAWQDLCVQQAQVLPQLVGREEGHTAQGCSHSAAGQNTLQSMAQCMSTEAQSSALRLAAAAQPGEGGGRGCCLLAPPLLCCHRRTAAAPGGRALLAVTLVQSRLAC
jgi:hypothetical protein